MITGFVGPKPTNKSPENTGKFQEAHPARLGKLKESSVGSDESVLRPLKPAATSRWTRQPLGEEIFPANQELLSRPLDLLEQSPIRARAAAPI